MGEIIGSLTFLLILIFIFGGGFVDRIINARHKSLEIKEKGRIRERELELEITREQRLKAEAEYGIAKAEIERFDRRRELPGSG
jgi:hypothetical protein